ARRQLSTGGRAGEANRRSGCRVHGAEGDDHLLQYGRLPPRRLRKGETARARDPYVGLPSIAEGVVRTELPVRVKRRCRCPPQPGATLRRYLADALRGPLEQRSYAPAQLPRKATARRIAAPRVNDVKRDGVVPRRALEELRRAQRAHRHIDAR